MRTLNQILVTIFLIGFTIATNLYAQNPDFNQIVVHIWGEVKNPGEYKVPDGTDVLGIISKAGGPTDFSRLSKVKLTRTLQDQLALNNEKNHAKNGAGHSTASMDNVSLQYRQRIVEIDISKYLKQNQKTPPLPVLKTGDIVFIPKNKWFTWKTVASVIRDVAIVANAYYWFQRSNQ